MNGAPVKAYSKEKDGEKKLSANFTVKEFACSDGSDVIFISDGLVQVLQAIRSRFKKPVVVNSGYRTPAHNKKVGGSTYSRHLYGYAADISTSGVSPLEVAAYVETLLPKTGCIGLYENYIHIDLRTTRYRYDKTTGKEKVVDKF